MTVIIFLFGLGFGMALGLPVAYALLATSLLLMVWLDAFDLQIGIEATSYPLDRVQ